jgi:hypothetical protein
MAELILEKSHIDVQKIIALNLSKLQEIYRNISEPIQEKGPLNVPLKAVVGPLQHQISEKCTLGRIREKDLTTAQNQDVGGHLPVQPIIKTT